VEQDAGGFVAEGQVAVCPQVVVDGDGVDGRATFMQSPNGLIDLLVRFPTEMLRLHGG